MKKINDLTFDNVVSSKEGLVLVDFGAVWCGPCRMMEPILEELSKTYNVCKVDIDESPEMAGKYNVSAVPTLIFFKNGKEIKRSVGLQSKEALIKVLENG